MAQLEYHPAAAFFPLMSEDQFVKLIHDIGEHGLLEPIVLYEGKILDGRNRYQACLKLGIEPVFEEAKLGEQSAMEYALSKNLHRRHLNAAQRAALALDLLPALSEQAAERRRWAGKKSEAEHIGNSNERGEAAERASQLVGLGHSTVEKAIAIQKRNPEVIRKMKSGEIKTVDAARRAAGMLPSSHTPISDELPQVYYGKGDKWREATQPILRYLIAWKRRGFEYRHLNHIEAKRRIKLINQIIEMLVAARDDLEGRSVKATTSLNVKPSRAKEGR